MKQSYQFGTVIQVGQTWRLRYREYDIDGKMRQPSKLIGTLKDYPNRAKAERAAENLRKSINERSPVITFGELAGKYIKDVLPTLRPHTQKTNLGNLKYLRDKFDSRRLDEISPGEMELWLNSLKSRQGKDLSKGTRKHIRNLAHNLWRHAMIWEYISPQINPISIVRVTKGQGERPRSTVNVDAETYQKLLEDPELIPVAKMIVRVAMTTGMGISEILGLRWEDSFDWRKDSIHVLRSVDGKHENPTKNDFRQNDVPMHPELAESLKAWKKTEEGNFGGWVFGSPQTNRPYHAATMLADHLKPAGKRAGIPNLGWHSFRHTFSVALDLAGASDRVQQRSMRHGNAAMTKHYGKHSPALFEAARKAQDVVIGKLKAI